MSLKKGESDKRRKSIFSVIYELWNCDNSYLRPLIRFLMMIGFPLLMMFFLMLYNGIKSIIFKTEPEISSKPYHDLSETEVEQIYTESIYKGNQLKNGASPFDGCFGEGIYDGNASLTIENGGNTDVIVCLYNTKSKRTIRNEYIRKKSNFKMTNISQGHYKIRVLYGNDWNPTLENLCNTKGNFESNVHFSEFDGTDYFEDNETGYTVRTVTLNSVIGGNATTSSIDKSTFFEGN